MRGKLQGTIQSLWERYLKQAITPDASRVQLSECKKAFYAGVATAVTLIAATDFPVVAVNEMWMELNKFRDEVLAGKDG